MTKTSHPAAILMDGGQPVAVVVEVDVELLDDFGDENVYEAVASHAWTRKQEVPALVGYVFDEEISFLGPEDLADLAAEQWDDLSWKHMVTLEWSDEDFEDDAEDEP